jgi:hypothetical protein
MEIDMIGVFQGGHGHGGRGRAWFAAQPTGHVLVRSWRTWGLVRVSFHECWGAIQVDAIACKLQHRVTSQLARG